MAEQSQAAQPNPNAWPAPPLKTGIYIFISILVGMTWGVGMNTFNANIANISWSLQASQQAASFLIPVYMGAYVTGILFFFKFRTQLGPIVFSRLGITVYWVTGLLHIFLNTVPEAMFLRSVAGFANGFMSPMAVLYAMEVLPPAKKMPWGFVFGLMLASSMVAGMKSISAALEQSNEVLNGLFTFEVGLATLATALVWLFPLSPAPKMRMFDWVDGISFPALFIGMISLATFLSTGTSFWWTNAPFLGYVGCSAIFFLCLFAIIENSRRRPVLKFSFFLTKRLLLFGILLFLMRILMGAQNVVFGDVMSNNGYGARQLTIIWGWVTFAEVCGMIFVGMVTTTTKILPYLTVFSLSFFTIGSGLNMFSSSATGPQQFLVGQMMIGFATGMFFPTMQTIGMGRSATYGKTGNMTYLLMFLTTQLMGALFDSALFNSYADIRENFHYVMINGELDPSRPEVAAMLQQYANAAGTISQDTAVKNEAAVQALSSITKQQAAVMAYNDMLIVITIIGLITTVAVAIAFLTITKKSKLRQKPGN